LRDFNTASLDNPSRSETLKYFSTSDGECKKELSIVKLLTHTLTLVSFNDVREQLRRGRERLGERGRKVKSGELAGKETQGKWGTAMLLSG